jgi:hypothetical protein
MLRVGASTLVTAWLATNPPALLTEIDWGNILNCVISQDMFCFCFCIHHLARTKRHFHVFVPFYFSKYQLGLTVYMQLSSLSVHVCRWEPAWKDRFRLVFGQVDRILSFLFCLPYCTMIRKTYGLLFCFASAQGLVSRTLESGKQITTKFIWHHQQTICLLQKKNGEYLLGTSKI